MLCHKPNQHQKFSIWELVDLVCLLLPVTFRLFPPDITSIYILKRIEKKMSPIAVFWCLLFDRWLNFFFAVSKWSSWWHEQGKIWHQKTSGYIFIYTIHMNTLGFFFTHYFTLKTFHDGEINKPKNVVLIDYLHHI